MTVAVLFFICLCFMTYQKITIYRERFHYGVLLNYSVEAAHSTNSKDRVILHYGS